MTRRDDWPERLGACVAARERAFAWGSHDCVLFAADCVAAVTGVDPAAGARGAYRDVRGAVRMLRRLGAKDVGGLADAALGAAIAPRRARRGDVAMTVTERGPALGVVLGAEAAFPGPRGLVRVPVAACVRAWAVGWEEGTFPVQWDSSDARTRFPSPRRCAPSSPTGGEEMPSGA